MNERSQHEETTMLTAFDENILTSSYYQWTLKLSADVWHILRAP